MQSGKATALRAGLHMQRERDDFAVAAIPVGHPLDHSARDTLKHADGHDYDQLADDE